MDRALGRAHANLSTANVALGTFAGNVAASFARMAVHAAGGLFEGTIRSASHLAETMQKTHVVLGDGAAKVIANADDMAERFGFVKKEVLDAGSSFALLGREMGMNAGASADFGIKLTKMAADAGSLADMELPQILEKMRAGLAGQVKPLRELGIFMTANAVKEEAARMGLKPGASGQLSEGDKIRARVSFIENSEFMKKASGDLARTLDQTENQTRKFWGTLSNLSTSVGEELNPAWNQLLQSFNTGLDDLRGYFEANRSMIRGWGASVVEGFETAKIVWRNLPDVVEIAMLGADQRMEDARAKIEQWATMTAVSVESAFLKAAQSVGNFFQGMQSGVMAAVGMQAGGVSTVVSALQSGAEGASKSFDKGVGGFSRISDWLLRPLRDVANATGLGMMGPNGKPMSVEEDFNRMQGTFKGIPNAIGGFNDYLKTFQSTLDISASGKPKDFTSGLIDKANKHLADTMAENTDISSKAIAAAQSRITKREAGRLVDLAQTAWEKEFMEGGIITPEETRKAQIDFEKDFMAGGMSPQQLQHEKVLANKAQKAWEEDFMAGGKATKFFEKGGGKGGAGDEDEDSPVLSNKRKHQKSIMDTASFAEQFQTAQLGGDVPDKQLTELQRIREYEAQNAANLEKMLTRNGMAVFA